MPRVIHFEINVDNPERASKFYGDTFGWQFQQWGGPSEYWLVTTGADSQPGINGGMMKRPHPGAATVNTIGVASVDESVAAVTKNGGKVVMPKTAIPTIGWFAYCTDTEGNTFGVMQADPNAR
jgi:predicted enzyme related to lactoylglutathione lyase